MFAANSEAGVGGNVGRGQGAGQGRGSMGGAGRGAGGNCVCSKCGKRLPHQRGQPCYEMKCPNCGNTMLRET
ncbi:MAG: hypothetical protein PHG44_06925 [Lentisphaeria bacterium]|jgi:hypothetical protein|nr:hypothetical protein [Lentisphaeria bacterium]MDY0176304.1 hypothetical protein [Lentisphaeria bacterium]NLZ59847.1 hypothetical protein [Lentisphaerota bacterium]